jgi:hypothetical protein
MSGINQKISKQKDTKTSTMLDSYRIGTEGAVKRIGAPHEHDILCGRGGAINAHVGNQHFRDWVHERKNRYNLARTKAEKANVANEIMDLVKQRSPPGRFLQRDQSSVMGSTTWWVECDDIKALAKTSQALREGAPSIREAHKDDLPEGKKRTTRKTKRNNSTSAAPRIGYATSENTSAVKRNHQTMQEQRMPMPVLTAVDMNMNVSQRQVIEQLKANVEAAAKQTGNNPSIPYTPALDSPPALPLPGSTLSLTPPFKRSRLSEILYLPPAVLSQQYPPQPHIVKPDDTPPIAPLPYPLPLNAIPDIETDQGFPMPAIPKRESSLRRINSLALSDVGSYESEGWGDIEFVNPFEGDDNMSLPPFSPFPERNASNDVNKYSRNSFGEKSATSEFSDLPDAADAYGYQPTSALADSEFGEAMKDVYDAVHPGLASPGIDEPIPTHLYPYAPGKFSGRGSGAFSSPQLIC